MIMKKKKKKKIKMVQNPTEKVKKIFPNKKNPMVLIKIKQKVNMKIKKKKKIVKTQVN